MNCSKCHKQVKSNWHRNEHKNKCLFKSNSSDVDVLFSVTEDNLQMVMNQPTAHQRVLCGNSLGASVKGYTPMVFLPKGRSSNNNPTIEYLTNVAAINPYTVLKKACQSSPNGQVSLPKFATMSCPNCPDHLIVLSELTKPMKPSMFLVQESGNNWIVSLVRFPSTPQTDTEINRTPNNIDTPDQIVDSSDQIIGTSDQINDIPVQIIDNPDQIIDTPEPNQINDTHDQDEVSPELDRMAFSQTNVMENCKELEEQSQTMFVSGEGDNAEVGSGRAGARYRGGRRRGTGVRYHMPSAEGFCTSDYEIVSDSSEDNNSVCRRHSSGGSISGNSASSSPVGSIPSVRSSRSGYSRSSSPGGGIPSGGGSPSNPGGGIPGGGGSPSSPGGSSSGSIARSSPGGGGSGGGSPGSPGGSSNSSSNGNFSMPHLVARFNMDDLNYDEIRYGASHCSSNMVPFLNPLNLADQLMTDAEIKHFTGMWPDDFRQFLRIFTDNMTLRDRGRNSFCRIVVYCFKFRKNLNWQAMGTLTRVDGSDLNDEFWKFARIQWLFDTYAARAPGPNQAEQEEFLVRNEVTNPYILGKYQPMRRPGERLAMYIDDGGYWYMCKSGNNLTQQRTHSGMPDKGHLAKKSVIVNSRCRIVACQGLTNSSSRGGLSDPTSRRSLFFSNNMTTFLMPSTEFFALMFLAGWSLNSVTELGTGRSTVL